MAPPEGILDNREDAPFPTPIVLRGSFPWAYLAAASPVPDEVARVRHVPSQLLLAPALQQADLRPPPRLPRSAGVDQRPTSRSGWPLTSVPTSAGPGRPVPFLPASSSAAWAVAVTAAGRAKGTALGVRSQLPQPPRVAAAPSAVVALHVQLLDQAAQQQDPVQLARRQRLALQRAPASPRRPGQQAAGAEDVPARRARGLLQYLATSWHWKARSTASAKLSKAKPMVAVGGRRAKRGVPASSGHPRAAPGAAVSPPLSSLGEVCE